eukprot:2687803-Alexandrium_andersonii.AAC.1
MCNRALCPPEAVATHDFRNGKAVLPGQRSRLKDAGQFSSCTGDSSRGCTGDGALDAIGRT